MYIVEYVDRGEDGLLRGAWREFSTRNKAKRFALECRRDYPNHKVYINDGATGREIVTYG